MAPTMVKHLSPDYTESTIQLMQMTSPARLLHFSCNKSKRISSAPFAPAQAWRLLWPKFVPLLSIPLFPHLIYCSTILDGKPLPSPLPLTRFLQNILVFFFAVEQYLQKSTSILIHSNIPKEVKLLVYRMQIVPKVLYVATKACWSIKQYRSLDRFPSQLLKHVGGHMPSSPNTMLYFPSDRALFVL